MTAVLSSCRGELRDFARDLDDFTGLGFRPCALPLGDREGPEANERDPGSLKAVMPPMGPRIRPACVGDGCILAFSTKSPLFKIPLAGLTAYDDLE
jgi:hypothetical protein